MRRFFLCLLVPILLSSWTPIDFYVSPTGNDANPGSKEKPFNTLHKAKLAVREHRISQPNENITVWIDDGKYIMKEPRFAFLYSKNILKHPWMDAEEYIKQDPYFWSMYQNYFNKV
jgi:hypothetical protein